MGLKCNTHVYLLNVGYVTGDNVAASENEEFAHGNTDGCLLCEEVISCGVCDEVKCPSVNMFVSQ